jgi:hypothetical protein
MAPITTGPSWPAPPPAAGEAGDVGRQLARHRLRCGDLDAGGRCGGWVEVRVGGQDPALQLLHRPTRLHALLLHQPLAQRPEGRQRVGLAARAVQRHHQQAGQPLPQRLRGHQSLQLGHQPVTAASVEVGLDAVLDHRQAALLQPGALLGQGRHLHVLKRPAPPQRQRGDQQPTGLLRIPGGEQLTALVGQVLEPRQVQLARLHAQQVPGCAVHQPIGVSAEQAPQLPDLPLQAAAGGRRRRVPDAAQ